ncbi:GspE/PulE family protein [Candidatus Parcubacteria bacterium]|nr:GspE/PulE family protein [Patescibacteria group bacterium]MBU4309853.1 GspE/PulE family protein [Patescibacteria group bacterium]MBU4431736.1 GspE/PulE family protein [Patescibacteria group bacterium]MBU4578192.1 GspE/PulE family protein [Patescibacteria group bacterium]MCG2696728.1 GspE/PulE family protein [Candidatus Parcubacteria bacterium]
MQSIEDLISSSSGGFVDEDSTEGVFAKKQKGMKIKEKERVAEQMAVGLGVPYINLFGFPISAEALSLIDEKIAIQEKIVCFFYDGENIRIAATNPDNPVVLKKMEEICAEKYSKGAIYLISDNSLIYALKQYASLPKIKKLVNGVEIKGADVEKFEQEINDYKSLDKKINEVNISDVVTLILAASIKMNSSDIHIEAEEKGIVIRYRIDGVLHDAAVIDKDKWKKIISRMKLLAKVKINIENKPQDGRFTIFLNEKKIDVRASFLPTSYGESVVMRLLFSDSVTLGFEQLGLRAREFEILKKEMVKPNGMILTTGPTGSGKTTSLYAILNTLNTENTKIITLENPIEYQLKGINQSQIDEKKGYTFANGLRSVLRQDPDVVMVGEIRDLETAEIAIQASLTGHLVLSTLHTNDAAGVIPRLIDMGVKSYFLTPSINALIGQRLIRKVCNNCKVEHVLTAEEKQLVQKILAVISPKAEVNIPNELPKIFKAGAGCEKCGGTGYKGRIGIYEILTMSDDVKELADNGAPAFKILYQAIENGMVTMLQDGVLKCMDGVTSLEEVYRVIGKFEYVDALYDVVVSKTLGRGFVLSDETLIKMGGVSSDILKSGGIIKNSSSGEMLNYILALAIKVEAGDIHIEPIENGVKVRFRIDGILSDVSDVTKENYIQILSKIKSTAGIATNIKQPTIDGRFSITFNSKNIDCRLSIISGAYGETVVIRMLTSQAAELKMEDLGIRPYSLEKINKAIHKSKGIVITTGPTGSGKTTTLYSALNKLNSPDVKIMTIEDPIEYHLNGILQTQIDSAGGYTFGMAIRSFMRQNPNIIMVGEIRDAETAKVAIEASLTGHLVLSTIHANSAAGAIARFVGLGMDRQALASSMECSIGQRLVRRVCQKCKKEIELDEVLLKEVQNILAGINKDLNIQIPTELKFYKGEGCPECSGIGYKGRIGIYEAISMDDEMQKIIQIDNVTNADIEENAVKNGTVLMIQDGILKALEGETTVEEVLRVAR